MEVVRIIIGLLLSYICFAQDFSDEIFIADGIFEVSVFEKDNKVFIQKSRSRRSYEVEVKDFLYSEELIYDFLAPPSELKHIAQHLETIDDIRLEVNRLLLKRNLRNDVEKTLKESLEIQKEALSIIRQEQVNPCSSIEEDYSSNQENNLIQDIEDHLSSFPKLPLGTHFRINDRLFYLNQVGDIHELIFSENKIDNSQLDIMDASGDGQALIGSFTSLSTGFNAATSSDGKIRISQNVLSDDRLIFDTQRNLILTSGHLVVRKTCLDTSKESDEKIKVDLSLCQNDFKMTDGFYNYLRNAVEKQLGLDEDQLSRYFHGHTYSEALVLSSKDHKSFRVPKSFNTQRVGVNIWHKGDHHKMRLTPYVKLLEGAKYAKTRRVMGVEAAAKIEVTDSTAIEVAGYIEDNFSSLLEDAMNGVEKSSFNCGFSAAVEQKISNNLGVVTGIDYYCPSTKGSENPSSIEGNIPYIAVRTNLSGVNCIFTFKEELRRGLYQTFENYRHSDKDQHLSDFAISSSCASDDGKGQVISFGHNSDGAIQIKTKTSFQLGEDENINASIFASLANEFGGSLEYQKDDTSIMLTGVSREIGDQFIGIAARNHADRDKIISLIPIGKSAQKSVQDFLETKQVRIEGGVELSAGKVSSYNKNIGQLEFTPKINETFHELRLDARVSAPLGRDSEVSANASLGLSSENWIGAGAIHVKANSQTDAFVFSRVGSVDATVLRNVGQDKKGAIVGVQLSSEYGVGLCGGMYEKAKNGDEFRAGVCTNGAWGQFFYQPNCPELYGSSCDMYTFGILGLSSIKTRRPGEYYMTEDGNIVGVRRFVEDGMTRYDFQLVQFPKEIRELRRDIILSENKILETAPLYVEGLDLDKHSDASKYKEWLARHLTPALETLGDRIKGVRVVISDKKSARNTLSEDGVLIIRNLDEPLVDKDANILVKKVGVKDTLESRKQKSADSSIVEREIENIESRGALLSLDTNKLSHKEQLGLSKYLNYLDQHSSKDQLEGRRIIVEDPNLGGSISRFLGLTDRFDTDELDLRVDADVLEELSHLNFDSKNVSFKKVNPQDCDKFKKKKEQELLCLKEALNSFLFTTDLDLVSKKIFYVTKKQMRRLNYQIKGSSLAPKILSTRDIVYIRQDRLREVLDPDYEKILRRKVVLRSKKNVANLLDSIKRNNFSYKDKTKEHRAKIVSSESEMIRMKYAGEEFYRLENVYGNSLNLALKGASVSDCVRVQKRVLYLYKKSAGANTGNGDCSSLKSTKEFSKIDLRELEENSETAKFVKDHLGSLSSIIELSH